MLLSYKSDRTEKSYVADKKNLRGIPPYPVNWYGQDSGLVLEGLAGNVNRILRDTVVSTVYSETLSDLRSSKHVQ